MKSHFKKELKTPKTTTTPKSKDTRSVACLNCRVNHKKCDGGRPCSHCVLKKIDCVENNKRKNVGRPRKEEEEVDKKVKVEHIQAPVKQIVFNKCEKCGTKQENQAKFCNQCGSRLPELVVDDNSHLLQEIDLLKKKNEELLSLLEMRQSLGANPMWLAIKLALPVDGRIVYPVPSFILETSPALLNFLGYSNMVGLYFPTLYPSSHHKVLDTTNFYIKVQKVEGMNASKLTCTERETYFKHEQGHYVHVLTTINYYFDYFTKLPSFAMLYIDKILSLKVKEKDVGNSKNLSNVTFYCNPNEDIPDMIKKFSNRPLSNVYKHDEFLSFIFQNLDQTYNTTTPMNNVITKYSDPYLPNYEQNTGYGQNNQNIDSSFNYF